MNRDKWQKAKEIFEDAMKLASGERPQFLDDACHGDDELRLEVESLLSSLDTAGSFLDKPAVGEVAEIIVNKNKKLAIGYRVSHYEIVSQIGEGGMGEVYLAQDTQLRRRVALKILPADFAADESRARRFKQEARAASQLNHPNILTIHEIGETDDKRLFIAAEHIEGETLRQLMNEKNLNWAEILEIAIQIANALVAAHETGIVHRDIKPENIMIRPDGYVKVLDFGLAKLIENPFQNNLESSTLAKLDTTSGMILGTVRYMSPEQARGQKIDARSDVFSFGIVLYEMIAGSVPFSGESNMDTLAAILNREPTPLTDFAPDVPKELQLIVNKALRKEQDRRYETMRDVLADLKTLRDDIQIKDKLQSHADEKTLIQPTLIGRAETTSDQNDENANETALLSPSDAKSIAAKSKRRKFTPAFLLVFGFIILLAAGFWLYRRQQNSFTVVSVQKLAQVTDWAGLDDYPSISPDGNSIAYGSDYNGNFEIYVKQLTPGAKEIQLTSDGEQNFQPAFSPDGKRIAYHSKGRGGIWVIPASGGEAKQLSDFGTRPAWSPDGKQIAFQSYPLTDLGVGARTALAPSTIWIASVDGSEQPRQITQAGNPEGGHGAPAFSPDGKLIAFEADSYNLSSVWVMPISGGEPHFVSKRAFEPVFAPDGKSLVYIGGSGVEQSGAQQIEINTDTGEPIGEAHTIGGNTPLQRVIRGLKFSTDGKRIAYSVVERRENLATTPLNPKTNESSGASAPIVQKVSGRIIQPEFSSDGKRIAFTSCVFGGTGCDIWVANSDGTNQTQLTTADSNESEPTWLSNGEEIAYVSDRTGHWTLWKINLNTKREQMLIDLKDNIQYIRFSPDEKQIVFNSERNGGVTNVWTSQIAGSEPKQLTFEKDLAGFPAWSPDGKWIAYQMKRGDSTYLMAIPSEGGTPEQLTFEDGQSWAYSWSPDSDKVLFAGFRNGLWNVYWVSRTTKKEQQLTDYKKLNAFARYPAWSPLGNQIVYEYSETTGNVWVADLK